MRKALKIVVGLLVVLVIILLAAPFFLDVNRYHDRIQAELQKKLGRQVSLGKMHLSLIPFAFKVDNAVVAEDPQFAKGSNFAEAQQLYVTAELMPLLHGDVQVKSLELRRPKIELIKNPAGVWNFASLSGTAPQQKAQPQPQAQQQPANKPSAATPEPQKQKAFSLDDFKITDGQVALTDLQKGQKRAVYDHIDLRLVGYAPDKPFKFDLAAHLPGSGAQLIELSGKAGPINQDDSLKTPFKGSIDLDHVSMSALQRFLNSAALANSDAVATGKADLSNENGKMTSSGSLKLEQARFNGNDLGYPIAADFDLSANVDSKLLNISKGNLKLGATPLAITGVINAQPTPAQIDVRLKASNVSIQEVARLAASLGVAFNPDAKVDGQVSADVRAQGSSKSPALNGSLAGHDLTISGGQLKSPVKVNNIELALSPDAVRSNNFTASTGKTNVSAQFALTHYSLPTATIDANVKTLNADLGELLTMAKAYGVKAVEGMNGSGAVVLDLHAVGPMKGTHAENVSGSGKLQNANATVPKNAGLVINGSLSGQNITISGAQLRSPVKLSAIQVALSPDSIRSNNFTASTGHTNVAVQFALSKYSSPSPFVDATVKTLNGDLGELLTIARAYGVSAVEGVNGSGAVALDLHAVGPIKGAGALNLSGSGKLQNATIQPDTLTKPLQIRNADLRFTKDSAIFENLNASIASTNASGTLTARNFTAPQVQFALNADKINVVELKSVFKSEPQKSAASSWSLVPTAYAANPAQPSLISRTSGTGTVSIGTVIDDKLVLNNVKSNVTIDKGVIRLAPITAEAYGGTTTGTIVVDARNTPMKYAVDTKLNNVDANKLLSAVSSLKNLYGIMATNAKLNFASDNDSADIARSLNGTVALGLNNGKIVGMDIPYELAAAGQFLTPGQAKRDFTNINKVTGNLNIQNGVAQTNDFKAFIDDGTIAAQGAANLADQTLNMHVMAVLSKEFSQRVGGTGVGGYMQTALSNRNGELVIPVIVTGTFQSPHFAPDLQKIAQMKLDNLVPTLTNPGQLSSIIGGVMGNKQPNGQPGQKQDAVGQILGALGGKQAQQQQQQGQQAPAQGQQQQGQTQGQTQPQQGTTPQQQQQQTGTTPQQQPNKQPSWGDILQGALGQKKQQQQPASSQPQDQQQQQQQQQQQKPKDYSEQPPEQPK